MPKEFFWLMCTIVLTGLMWVPYILDRSSVRGLAVAMGNPGSGNHVSGIRNRVPDT